MLALLVLALGCQDTLPSGADRALPAELVEALGAVDAERVGWGSEVRGSRAGNAVKALAKGLLHGGLPEGVELAEGFRTRGLLPFGVDRPEGSIEHVGCAHRPAEGGLEGVLPPGEDGLLEAARSLFLSSSDAELSGVKIVRVEEHDEASFSTEAVVHFTNAEETLDLSLTWRLDWNDADGLVLERLEVLHYAEVRGPAPLLRPVRLPLEVDPRAPDWTAGTNELRRTLDLRLGLPLLGAPAGIALGDVDGDGLEDVYLTQPGGLPNRLLVRTRLSFGFVDASSRSGADFLDFSRGALLVDLDGDADPDLVVSVGNELLLLENDGSGHFDQRQAIAAPQATSLAAADYDLDGDLDLYVCSYFSPYRDDDGEGAAHPVPYHDANNGLANLFLENRTTSEGFAFADVTAAVGLDANNRRFSFAAAWEDYDADGDPDLYVANDFGRNNLYRNDDGTFTDVAAAAGVEDVAAGMGVSWGDYDGDGDFDLYVSNMFSSAGGRIAYQRHFGPAASEGDRALLQRHARGNSLFANQGDGTFVDVSEEAGVTLGRWAWGARFVDLDLDGRLDIVSPNGFLTAGERPDL